MPACPSARTCTHARTHAAGTAGGTGHVIEFAGSVFAELSVEARMSVRNASARLHAHARWRVGRPAAAAPSSHPAVCVGSGKRCERASESGNRRDGGTEGEGDVRARACVTERGQVCNMAIEAGARAGMVAPDEKTFEYTRTHTRTHARSHTHARTYTHTHRYLRGRPLAPSGETAEQAER